MDFEYTGSIHISKSDLRHLYLAVKRGEDFYDAYHNIMCGYDDCDYYNSGLILDDVKKEIDRRLKQAKGE